MVKVRKAINETVQKDGRILLKGKKAVLLAEACKLNRVKKEAEKRIKEIKTEMDLKKPGEYINEAKDTLVLSESDNFTPVDPKTLYDTFKKKKMISKYFDVVQVHLGSLGKFLPKSAIAKMRQPLDPTQKWSFK